MTDGQLVHKVETLTMFDGEVLGSSFSSYTQGQPIAGGGSGGVGGGLKPGTLTRTTFRNGASIVLVRPQGS